MRLSILTDILRGLSQIHASAFEAHGRLTSKSCYIDGRFILKVGDYGLPSFFSLTHEETQELKDTSEIWETLLWTAPEHIGIILGGEMTNFVSRTFAERRQSIVGESGVRNRKKKIWTMTEKPKSERERTYLETIAVRSGTKQGDVFSVAIIMSEICLLAKPYCMFPTMTSKGR